MARASARRLATSAALDQGTRALKDFVTCSAKLQVGSCRQVRCTVCTFVRDLFRSRVDCIRIQSGPVWGSDARGMASIPVELAAALDTRLLASGRAIVDARARAVIAVLDASAATEAVAAITRFAAEHKRCPDSITSGIARFLFALLWHGATTHWVDSGVAKKLVAAHVDVLNRLTHPKFIRSCSHTVAQLLTSKRFRISTTRFRIL